MNSPNDERFLEDLRRDLVRFAHGMKTPNAYVDAEDLAQAALLALVTRGGTITYPRAYAHTVVRSEAVRAEKSRHREPTMDLDSLASLPAWPDRLPATYHRDDADTRMRDLLVLLRRRPQQQKAAGLAYLEWTNKEIADRLGVKEPTTRSNLRNARKTLKPHRDTDEHTVRYGLAWREVWEAFLRGETLPGAPRRVIIEAWQYAKSLGVDPERGAPATVVEPDELARRRERCRLDTARSRVLADLAWLAMRAGMMMVVTDPDAIVLWRGGDPRVIRKADKLGFVHGADWGMAAQGVNGISLSLATRRAATVRRCEHFVETHHALSCIALLVRNPREGGVSCCVNLPGTGPTVHRAIALELDSIARRMMLWLGTCGTS